MSSDTAWSPTGDLARADAHNAAAHALPSASSFGLTRSASFHAGASSVAVPAATAAIVGGGAAVPVSAAATEMAVRSKFLDSMPSVAQHSRILAPSVAFSGAGMVENRQEKKWIYAQDVASASYNKDGSFSVNNRNLSEVQLNNLRSRLADVRESYERKITFVRAGLEANGISHSVNHTTAQDYQATYRKLSSSEMRFSDGTFLASGEKFTELQYNDMRRRTMEFRENYDKKLNELRFAKKGSDAPAA